MSDNEKVPLKLKQTISVEFLYDDVINGYSRFFDHAKTLGHFNRELLYEICHGFQPRHFSHEDEDDHIIYDEDQEVEEMNFIQDGSIGIGFSVQQSHIHNRPYIMSKVQKNSQMIGDHYVINKKKSQFIYMALETSKGFALQKSFLHK